jgi:hypothetical protein
MPGGRSSGGNLVEPWGDCAAVTLCQRVGIALLPLGNKYRPTAEPAESAEKSERTHICHCDEHSEEEPVSVIATSTARKKSPSAKPEIAFPSLRSRQAVAPLRMTTWQQPYFARSQRLTKDCF